MTDVRAALTRSGGTDVAATSGADLRLAGLALGTWLATVLALRLPQHAAVTLAAASASAAAVAALVTARLPGAAVGGGTAVPVLLTMEPFFVGGA